MSHKILTRQAYAITKNGMVSWFLYTVENCSFGKRIKWTQNPKTALIFSSEEAIEVFKEKVLQNVPVGIHRFSKRPND